MQEYNTIEGVSGNTIFYRRYGRGPAIVLIHGFPESGELWSAICPLLQQKFTVIVPDMPGVGGSSYLGPQLTVEQMAGIVKQVLDREGISKAVIAGHSMGGYVAVAFADLYPSYVAGISMVHSIPLADTPERIDLRRKSIELIRKGGKELFIKQMIPNLFNTEFKKEHPEELQQQINKALFLEGDSLIAFYNAMINRHDRTNTLQDVDFAVQWIAGKQDNLILPEKLIQQTRLASVNFVEVYNDCAHMSMIEQPKRLAADIEDFAIFCTK